MATPMVVTPGTITTSITANGTIMGTVIGIVALALLGNGMFLRFGAGRETE